MVWPPNLNFGKHFLPATLTNDLDRTPRDAMSDSDVSSSDESAPNSQLIINLKRRVADLERQVVDLIKHVSELVPLPTIANNSNRAIDALMILPQHDKCAFAEDLFAIGNLCHATRSEESLWSALARVRRGQEGKTVLMYAAHRGDVVRINWLLDCWPHPNEVTCIEDSQRSALYFACEAGQLEAVRALARRKSDAGMHCATVAIENGHKSTIAALLVSFRSDHTSKCHLLMLACQCGRGEIVRLLITAGADVNWVNHLGQTALMHAAENGSLSAINSLIIAGAVLNTVSTDTGTFGGRTALHFALQFEKVGAAIALIAKGADVTIRNAAGKSASDMIEELHSSYDKSLLCEFAQMNA